MDHTMETIKKICIVVPCYNEEVILCHSAEQLLTKLNALIEQKLILPDSFLLFVDDGSKDRTWEIINDLSQQHPYLVSGLKLAANRGHQNALLAGLLNAKDHADAAISIDADLQDDIEVIDQFVKEFYLGNDIVYGVRSDRTSDSFFKRFTAESFYKFMNFWSAGLLFCVCTGRLTVGSRAMVPIRVKIR